MGRGTTTTGLHCALSFNCGRHGHAWLLLETFAQLLLRRQPVKRNVTSVSNAGCGNESTQLLTCGPYFRLQLPAFLCQMKASRCFLNKQIKGTCCKHVESEKELPLTIKFCRTMWLNLLCLVSVNETIILHPAARSAHDAKPGQVQLGFTPTLNGW